MAENIQMCQFSFQFLSDIGQILAVDGCDPPDIQLRRRGYLFLASSDGEDVMQKNYALQRYWKCYWKVVTAMRGWELRGGSLVQVRVGVYQYTSMHQ